MLENLLPAGLIGIDLLIGALAVFAAGLIRGFSGFGSALITAPMLSWVWGPQVGVPVAALIEIAPALQLTPKAIPVANWRTVWAFSIPALILLPVGSWILVNAPSDDMRRGIAVVVLLLVAVLWSGWRYRGPRGLLPEVGVGVIGGTLAGASGVAGPPAILYSMSGDDSPAVIRANLIGYFTMVLLGFLIVFTARGLITIDVLWRVGALIPVFIVGTAIGTKMFGMASERTFRNIALATLAISSTWVLLV